MSRWRCDHETSSIPQLKCELLDVYIYLYLFSRTFPVTYSCRYLFGTLSYCHLMTVCGQLLHDDLIFSRTSCQVLRQIKMQPLSVFPVIKRKTHQRIIWGKSRSLINVGNNTFFPRFSAEPIPFKTADVHCPLFHQGSPWMISTHKQSYSQRGSAGTV